MFCEELFKGIKEKAGSGITFEVKFSMLEIYNEIARDLLDSKSGQKKSGLKIRQHPKRGFYGKYLLNNMFQNVSFLHFKSGSFMTFGSVADMVLISWHFVSLL